MRILARSYDLEHLGGSGATLRAIVAYLSNRGAQVWATNRHVSLADVRAWAPDLILSHQWATAEASSWATTLGVPFVMIVHGPGQYEQFQPQCDLVLFNTHVQLELARAALGRTASLVVHPPVWRKDLATEECGNALTLIGTGIDKGVDIFVRLANAIPDEQFLLVTDDPPAEVPSNLEVLPRRHDIRSVYARTKLLLLPTRYESYGRVLVEAAMSGIPSVATDTPGIREAVEECATLVGPGDDWETVVRASLTNLHHLRSAARSLADRRDPEAELAALYAALLHVASAGRRQPTLTLSMTVANEADTLEQAVASVAPYVDEIVIGVDTRSTDDTGAIAQRLATRTFTYTESSPPDFPRMRNRAMQLVATDWALVLDGHEWIEGAEFIRSALETTAWSIEIQTMYEPDEQRVPGVTFPFPRIHRRHVRFAGAPAHEEVNTPLVRRDRTHAIKVWHERKPGAAASAREHDKSGAELAVLRSAWQERGDRRALFYLANGLREAGRLPEAIDAYTTYLDAPNWLEEGWQARLFLARCYAMQHDQPAARRAFEEAIVELPERAEALVGLGHVLLGMGELHAAEAWFRMATALREPLHARLFVETPVYRWVAWHGLAMTLARLQDYAGAADAEERALAGGAAAWANQNIALWRQLAQETRDTQLISTAPQR